MHWAPPVRSLMNQLRTMCPRIKAKDATKLQDEYAKLVEGLAEAEAAAEDDVFMANPSEQKRSFLFDCLRDSF